MCLHKTCAKKNTLLVRAGPCSSPRLVLQLLPHLPLGPPEGSGSANGTPDPGPAVYMPSSGVVAATAAGVAAATASGVVAATAATTWCTATSTTTKVAPPPPAVPHGRAEVVSAVLYALDSVSTDDNGTQLWSAQVLKVNDGDLYDCYNQGMHYAVSTLEVLRGRRREWKREREREPGLMSWLLPLSAGVCQCVPGSGGVHDGWLLPPKLLPQGQDQS